jgi:hypothetical protein
VLVYYLRIRQVSDGDLKLSIA